MTLQFLKKSKFTNYNVYCIRITGIIQTNIKDYWQDIERAEVEEKKDGKKETSMVVRIRDQAELIGLITLLYNWNHEIISVQLEQASFH